MTHGEAKRTVALFVDLDHLRRHTELASHPVCHLSSALEAIVCRVQELGHVAVANVYADWDHLPDRSTEVKRLHLDSRFVLPGEGADSFSMTRSSGTVVTLALDAMNMLFEESDIDTFVLVGDDPGFTDLMGRLQARRKSVMLIAFEKSLHPALKSAAREFEPIESYVQPAAAEEEDTPPSPESWESAVGSSFNWEPFVLLLNRLENSLPFVSLKYLKNQVLTSAHGCSNTPESKTNLIREAIRLHLVETKKIPNPKNPPYQTTTCKLNRRSSEVRRILGGS